MKGEVFELPPLRDTVGHEQAGARYAVVVQNEDFDQLSTWLICPTSTSASAASWRPEVTVRGRSTRVLVEQMRAVDPSRLGRRVGFLPFADILEINKALKVVLGL